MVSYIEMCTEDEDSWEEQNFKCPHCSQELISHDDLIKHMENKHSMVIFLYNFIIFHTIINNMYLLESLTDQATAPRWVG